MRQDGPLPATPPSSQAKRVSLDPVSVSSVFLLFVSWTRALSFCLPCVLSFLRV